MIRNTFVDKRPQLSIVLALQNDLNQVQPYSPALF